MSVLLKKLKSIIILTGALCALFIAGAVYSGGNAAFRTVKHTGQYASQMPEEFFILPSGNMTSLLLSGTVRRNDNSNAVTPRRTALDNSVEFEIAATVQRAELCIFAEFVFQDYLKNSLPARAGPQTV